MAVRIFILKGVPDDEAQGVRDLLKQNNLEFYETPEGNWGISVPAIWLKDKNQFEQARDLIEAYERERSQRLREEYRQLKSEGKTPSIWSNLRERPLQVILYLAFALVILYFSTHPFLSFTN